MLNYIFKENRVKISLLLICNALLELGNFFAYNSKTIVEHIIVNVVMYYGIYLIFKNSFKPVKLNLYLTYGLSRNDIMKVAYTIYFRLLIWFVLPVLLTSLINADFYYLLFCMFNLLVMIPLFVNQFFYDLDSDFVILILLSGFIYYFRFQLSLITLVMITASTYFGFKTYKKVLRGNLV